MLLAQADGGVVYSPERSGSGAAILSLLLHVGAAALLIGFEAAPRPAEIPESQAVEIVFEAPPPPTSIVASPVPQAAPVRAVAREAVPMRPRPVQPAKPAVSSNLPSAPRQEATQAQLPVGAAEVAASPALPNSVEPVDYGAYVGRLHQRIVSHRIYPPQAMRRREEGDVRLRILLAGDGSLVDIFNLAEASAQLTQAARAAIQSAAPFDPPPRGGGGERRLAFDVTVAFRLH